MCVCVCVCVCVCMVLPSVGVHFIPLCAALSAIVVLVDACSAALGAAWSVCFMVGLRVFIYVIWL